MQQKTLIGNNLALITDITKTLNIGQSQKDNNYEIFRRYCRN